MTSRIDYIKFVNQLHSYVDEFLYHFDTRTVEKMFNNIMKSTDGFTFDLKYDKWIISYKSSYGNIEIVRKR